MYRLCLFLRRLLLDFLHNHGFEGIFAVEDAPVHHEDGCALGLVRHGLIAFVGVLEPLLGSVCLVVVVRFSSFLVTA